MYVSLEECIMSCSRQRQRIMDSRRRLSIASTRYVFENIAGCCFFSQRQPEKKSNKHFLIVDVFLFSNRIFCYYLFSFSFSSIVFFILLLFIIYKQSKNMDVRNGPSLDVFYQAESASNVVKGGTII